MHQVGCIPGISSKTVLWSGKSRALEYQFLQAARRGVGVCYVDPHGDSFYHLLCSLALVAARIPKLVERVVIGQRLMQASSDILLGWLQVESPVDGQSRDFYGRQLKDWKGSAEIDQMIPEGMAIYGRLCGWTLARAHARSGDRIAVAAYLGNGDNFDRAILEFCRAYADRNERDYQLLADAVESGRITAQTGL